METTDKDTGENAEVSLELAENSGNKFKIDSVTGEILVTGSLDREEQDEYLLKVVATERVWRPETSVGINIQDMNDNSPVFDKTEYMMIFPPSPWWGELMIGTVTGTTTTSRQAQRVLQH